MIEREVIYIPTCDSCGRTIDGISSPYGSRQDAAAALHEGGELYAQGWRLMPFVRAGRHSAVHCPDCAS